MTAEVGSGVSRACSSLSPASLFTQVIRTKSRKATTDSGSVAWRSGHSRGLGSGDVTVGAGYQATPALHDRSEGPPRERSVQLRARGRVSPPEYVESAARSPVSGDRARARGSPR